MLCSKFCLPKPAPDAIRQTSCTMIDNKTQKMQLLMAIEISPYDYADAEYEYPTGSSSQFPDEWNEFWIRCLSDSNLGDLCAISKGSYLVDIETIKDAELEEIVSNELKEVEWKDFEEQVHRMSGGIVVKENGVSCIEPMCCGDIGNMNGWLAIFEAQPNEWTQLWIGHPWLYYKRENDMVAFSDYTESTPADFSGLEVHFQFAEEEFKQELQKIAGQLKRFELRIRAILDKMGILNAERIAKLMTGNA